jgi:hypothetical protein
MIKLLTLHSSRASATTHALLMRAMVEGGRFFSTTS